MRRGVDYSFDPPTPAELVAAGATFVVRYVGLPGTPKNLRAAEAKALSAAGLDLAAVCQFSDDFMLDPQRNGARDAEMAWMDANRCGMPADRPIYFALDINPNGLTTDQWAQIHRYLGQAAGYLGQDRVGIYGGLQAINNAVGHGWATYGWQTRSWSVVGGQVQWSHAAGLRQVLHNQPLGSGLVDWNEASVEDFGQWKVNQPAMSIARYPRALWRPLQGEEQNEPVIRPTQVIFHTMVGFLDSTEHNFDREGNPIESHFGLGSPDDMGRGGADGEFRQWMPMDHSADANFRANRRPDGTGAISIECADGGSEFNPLSPLQLSVLVRFGNWAADNLGIPRRICRDPGDPGFGYHTLFGAPSDWTPVAKTCPGPVRIRQIRDIVFPAILAGRNLEEEPVEVTSFNPDADKELREQARLGSQDTLRSAVGTGPDDPASDWFDGMRRDLTDVETKVEAIQAALANPVPVVVDADAVAEALATNATFLQKVATAVADEQHRRSAE